jgi:hypothetical protein
MLPLYDVLMKADNGRAMDLLSKQFDLSRQQAELAVEALTPAFSEGLKRNASDPYGVGAFLQALAGGGHAKYFEDAARAFQPSGVAEGNGILGHLFGSKEVSRAIAAQVAKMTGISQETIEQMLPALASMIMGGLAKQSTGQLGSAGSNNPLVEMMEKMMRQGGMAMPQAPQPGASRADAPWGDNPFGKVLEGMFGGAAGGASPSGGDNPFGRMFEEMMGGGAAKPAAKKPQANPSGRPRNPYDDLFGGMFEAGGKAQDDYRKSLGQIFEQFGKGMDGRR